MTTDNAKSSRSMIDDYDLEDSNREVLRDKRRRSFSLLVMDNDPTGLTPVQKQALCNDINKGVPFDRALDNARSATGGTTQQPGSTQPFLQAIADSDDCLASRKERISNRWRDADAEAPPPTPVNTITREDVDRAMDRRNERLTNGWRESAPDVVNNAAPVVHQTIADSELVSQTERHRNRWSDPESNFMFNVVNGCFLTREEVNSAMERRHERLRNAWKS
ncbi:hypothetical protein [Nitrobacter vulgaris]|uniref:Uncharacterized protein n=1 Tax=Nitrobacter vulgaris TaxID=29421 RepID=A0A1V4HWS5_NITVU|nr:hypothetical protein [Nitrobacter vulgaris]OPH82383.1 hypothetical protein B2M20_12405 [Nitrobacter vulgaris]